VRERGVELVDSNPDVLISVMYDRVLSEFPARSFNFHPGVLPQYRGSGAFSWAIINGEVETGITLHEIDEDIDHGAIIDIVRFPVDPNDTAGTLYERGMQYLFFMFQRWFDRIVSGDYTVISQDKWRGRIYYRRDLEREKDLTRYARAFEFADKERAFYYNRKGEKVELVW
jgi:methionyl-tRNA formyltransferase